MKSAVRIRNLSKSFEGITVLDRIGFDIAPGEIHGLIGENGSGKSTLVKILGGVHTPDEGSICEVGQGPLEFPVTQPQNHGIAIIHQDLALCDEMSVAENIGISSGFDTAMLAPFRLSREAKLVRRLAGEFGFDVDPMARVATLTPAERSVVAILRGLRLVRQRRSDHILVLDEPTAALPHAESEQLLSIVRGLAEAGTAVLFISHRLHEVLDVCDRVSVLRSGRLVATVATSGTTDAELVRMMLGYEIGAFYPDRHIPEQDRDVLSVRGLGGGTVEDVTFGVGPGEIVGVTGLVGMGQEGLPYLINGHAARSTGTVVVNGAEVRNSVRAGRQAGIALVPGNRLRDSMWGDGTAAENLTLPFVTRFTRRGFLRHREEHHFVVSQLEKFDVRPRNPAQHITRFSGGNQQKVVLSRWLATEPRVLLLHEPTQGVDAGARKEIFEMIRRTADAGAAIVVFSSDVEEVAHVCHRVLVLRHGRVAAQLSENELSEDRLITACQGATPKLERK
ncbi:sugar ABC transporter ATP-binding protein [Streptomyces sp. NBC_00988]|uniref:sugar ABC transporter ATP-binding protein n=1 Tax=Streptomyces sp. NBC_00988 TaxID=2903704 RepID=UPI00386927B6|nr:sugar ABC transporter ATP-binding protein [Streptomyces sp. NBC_00988]